VDFEQPSFDFDREPEPTNGAPSENHKRFLKHLKESEPTRWMVARWLTSRGYSVQLQGMKEAPTAERWKEFADEGDLYVTMRVETKQLTCDFTCREDWPFRKDFIVCARHSFDLAQPKPYAYVILNRAGTHAAFVLTSGWKQWRVGTRTDSRYEKVAQEFYFAPLESIVFAALEQPPT